MSLELFIQTYKDKEITCKSIGNIKNTWIDALRFISLYVMLTDTCFSLGRL